MASAFLRSIAVVIVVVAASIESAAAATLDPNVFTSLGALSPTAGSFTIDTDAMTIIDAANSRTPLFTGVGVSQ